MTAEGLEALKSVESSGKLPKAPQLTEDQQAGEQQQASHDAEQHPAEGFTAEALYGEGQGLYLTTILREQTPQGKSIALVNLAGTIISRAPAWAGGWGYINPQLFASTVMGLADNGNVGAIVLVMDCNGGTVTGTQEAADAVAYASRKKPGKVFALAADMCLSAAYWIASQASQVIASPTSLVGSIGVITNHVDYSAALSAAGIVVTFIRSVTNKARGQPYEPLSAEALAERQYMVNALHGQFTSAVQKGRKVSKTQLEKWTGDPVQSIWVGSDAVTAGLADRVASLPTILAELTGRQAPPPRPQPEQQQEGPDTEQDDADAQALAQTPEAADPAKPAPVKTSSLLAFDLAAGDPYIWPADSAALALYDADGNCVAQAPEGGVLEYVSAQGGRHTLETLPAKQQQPDQASAAASADPAAAALGGQAQQVTEGQRAAPLSPNQVTEDRTLNGSAKAAAGAQDKPTDMEVRSMNIKEILAKVNAGSPLSAEEQTALEAHLTAQREKASAVNTAGLPAEVVKAIQEGAAAKAELAQREERDAQAAAVAKAKELGQPESYAATYRKVSEALKDDPTALADYEQSVRAAGAQQAMTKELGSENKGQPANAAAAGGTLEQQLSARASAEMKADSSLSYRAACDKVFAADPAFAQRYASAGGRG